MAIPVTPHIFGRTQPPSVISDTTPPPAGQVQAFGALRTGYEVDISQSGGGGGFWSAWYGKAPDVALNHPERWTVKLKVSDPGDGSCRPFNANSSDLDCVVLGARLPPGLGSPIWLSSFHRMRGFFITGPNGGPQLTTATTGDQLLLQARVYNLSLAPLPSGAIVHVPLHGHAVEHEREHPRRPQLPDRRADDWRRSTAAIQFRCVRAKLDAGAADVFHERHELRRAELRQPGSGVLGGRVDRDTRTGRWSASYRNTA